MAVYRLGDMIRMRREALGMTQSQLVQIYDGREEGEGQDGAAEVPGKNEICSVQALRRIENGGVERVKIEVFRRLMLKMGQLPERIYASILVTDSRALRLKTEIHVDMARGEYEEAERKLDELEKMLVPGYPRNEQYRMAKRAELAYERGMLEKEAYAAILLDALRYTVPQLEKIDIASWPFNEDEFDILQEIANVYHTTRNREKLQEFLQKMKENVEKAYMDGDHYVVWHTCLLGDLSQLMCMEDEHEASLEYCGIGMEECRRQRILGSVHRFFFDAAWNRENQIKKGIYPGEAIKEEAMKRAAIKKERESCRKQLARGYYLCVAQGEIQHAERVRRLYERNYPDAVRLL